VSLSKEGASLSAIFFDLGKMTGLKVHSISAELSVVARFVSLPLVD
jgi:hypothetical protein